MTATVTNDIKIFFQCLKIFAYPINWFQMLIWTQTRTLWSLDLVLLTFVLSISTRKSWGIISLRIHFFVLVLHVSL